MLLLNVWGTLLNRYEVGISILTGEKKIEKKILKCAPTLHAFFL